MNATTTPASGRWYGTGTLLPTGHVLATSGADRDEVAVPGAEIPPPHRGAVRPADQEVAQRGHAEPGADLPQHRHADARRPVLVGGHATISNSYLKNITLPGGVTAPNGRDPTFEIYRPPYLTRRASRRSSTGGSPGDKSGTITTDGPAGQIRDVMAMRNTSVTHVVDSDQRSVKLRVLSRKGNTITVAQAPNGNVMPPGPYMLFREFPARRPTAPRRRSPSRSRCADARQRGPRLRRRCPPKRSPESPVCASSSAASATRAACRGCSTHRSTSPA